MFLAFDLDGTLADPSEGVTCGINHTLTRLGRKPRTPKDLFHYIGPPTEWIFADVLDTTDNELVEKAREIFSEYYRTVGYKQNHLYPGTQELVHALKQDGHYLTVVTSKSNMGAQKAAEHFKLANYFKGVFGRINDCSKIDSLKLALSTSDIRPAVMIGDRKFDIEAGKRFGLLTIGVTYGFGSRKELEQHQPDHIVDTQMELLELIRAISK